MCIYGRERKSQTKKNRKFYKIYIIRQCVNAHCVKRNMQNALSIVCKLRIFLLGTNGMETKSLMWHSVKINSKEEEEVGVSPFSCRVNLIVI